ncbi:MAG: transcription-repair coupling factor [Leptonema sp. (in: bacteria)]
MAKEGNIFSKEFKNFYKDFFKDKEHKIPFSVYHLPASCWAFFISSFFYEYFLKDNSYKAIFVILPDSILATKLYNEINFFIGKEFIYYFPEYDGIPYEWNTHDISISGERIKTLYSLKKNNKSIVITTIKAIARKIFPESIFLKTIELKVKQEINLYNFLQQLLGYGYTRVNKIENIGEFCIKGEIIDVFPVHLENPIRISLFDKQIESIRFFEIESQRSIQKISEIEIYPTSEITLNQIQFINLKKNLLGKTDNLKKPDWLFNNALEQYPLINARDLPGLVELISSTFDLVNIFDLLKVPFICFLGLEDQIRNQFTSLKKEYEILYKNYKNQKIAVEPEKILDFDILKKLQQYPFIKIHYLHKLESNFEETSFTQDLLVDSYKFKGKITEFRNYLVDLLNKNHKVYITSFYDFQLDRIKTILKNEKIPFTENINSYLNHNIFLIKSKISEGFIYKNQFLYFITESDIFGKAINKKFFQSTKTSPLESYLDLKEGDYVVHIHHGIGKFLRLERVQAAGIVRDCLVIEYANKDILYVPLDQISMVHRYISSKENPPLDSLGKASFKRIKEKVEKNVEKFAKELLEIYATRLQQKGFAFLPDTPEQKEFEYKFPYEETPDQIRAIEEVKKDMESDKVMDRLICGDVGYGKTEVAIRAVFKCVTSGKQAAIICPTTILARQHYNTFKERFADYPFRIDWISSLRTNKENQLVKKELNEGKIDVIIGTHALLSKDVNIPNLGLLVIDEEQRFGVLHKEKLKKIKKTVDVLTLTATPIPRTLHMSLIGIRDLSIINTPPRERKPVETYVLENSDLILKEAILKELERNGQIFYIHNRIQDLPMVSEKIRSLVPEIRIAILNSKMNDYDIDVILNDFLDRKYDLLLTTTIIENGIDMPNVNTLIVDDSDKFGLSQLYQIRGRVGRSDKQAYAYFFHRGNNTLTEEASKRLNTLLEYQELGSGFKIAMRDLEIRGAGNILGKEQSGDIIEIGYELYLKLLETAIKKIRGEKIDPEIHCNIFFSYDFFISEIYIKDTRQRIEFYKKLESATQLETYENILLELQDRFGTPDEKTKIFLLLEKIKVLGKQLGIESIAENKGEIWIKPSSNFKVPIEKLLIYIKKNKKGLFLKTGNTKYIFLDTKKSRYLKEKGYDSKNLKIQTTVEDLENLIQILLDFKEFIELPDTKIMN